MDDDNDDDDDDHHDHHDDDDDDDDDDGDGDDDDGADDDDADDDDDYEDDDVDYTDNGRFGRKNSARNTYEDEYMDRRSGGRRRRRQQNNSATDWSPFSMLESFLGIDREEMDYKADLYNAKMGLGKRRRSSTLEEDNLGRGRNMRRRSQRRRSARDDPERRGYAYRYDATLDDESSPILDIDLTEDEESESTNSDSKRL